VLAKIWRVPATFLEKKTKKWSSNFTFTVFVKTLYATDSVFCNVAKICCLEWRWPINPYLAGTTPLTVSLMSRARKLVQIRHCLLWYFLNTHQQSIDSEDEHFDYSPDQPSDATRSRTFATLRQETLRFPANLVSLFCPAKVIYS